MKSCPYCGNPETEEKQEKRSEDRIYHAVFCPICNKSHDFKYIYKSNNLLDMFEEMFVNEMTEKYGREFGDYVKEFQCYEPWEIFLYKKNEENKIVLNLSDDNVNKCEQIYNINPYDINHLLRLLLLKIFSDKDYKVLSKEFLVLWGKKQVSIDCFISIFLYERTEAFIPKLEHFFRFLLKENPIQFLNEIIMDIGEFSRVLSIPFLVESIEPNLVVKNFALSEKGYPVYYLMAMYYYKLQKWFEAYCLFEKLRSYNNAFKIQDEELLKLSEEVFTTPPTIDGIEKRTSECFEKINFADESERKRFQDLVSNINVVAWATHNENKEQSKNEVYLSVYVLFTNILTKLAEGEFEEAFETWVNTDKSNMRFIGLDIWKTTQYLKRIKDGNGLLDSNLGEIFSNPFIESFGIISTIEGKLRNFIKHNLINCYGDEENALSEGVPNDVWVEAFTRKREKRDRKAPVWAFFTYPDYLKIICGKENWGKIFRRYFLIDKSDSQKSKEELTDFIKRLIYMRNTVVHGHRPLEKEEKDELKNISALVDKIYEKWQADIQKKE